MSGNKPVTALRGYELRVLVLLGLAYGFAYFDRMAITFLSPFVRDELSLTNENIAWLGAGLSLTWALGAYFIGRWSDTIGKRKPFLLVAMVVFSLCSLFSGMAWNFESLLAARLLMGAVEGPFLPICLAILLAASAESRKGLNAGIAQNVCGTILGAAIAAPLLIWIAEGWGWRMAFYVAAVPGLILAVLIWRFVREPEPAVATEAETLSRASLSPWALLKVRNIWLCSVVSCFAVGSVVIGSIFMPLYLDGPLGFTPTRWGWIMFFVGLSPAVGGVLATLYSDRVGRRQALVIFAFLMMIGPAALLWFNGSVEVLTMLMFVSWMGLGTFPLFMGVIPAETLGRLRAATAMGLVVAIGELTGGVVGTVVAGRLADSFSLAVPIYMQLGLAGLAGIAAIFITETNPRVLARRKERQNEGVPA